MFSLFAMFGLRRLVSLDNNATTRVAPAVAKTMVKVLRTCHGNPSSNYRLARDSATVLQDARQRVAEAVGAAPEEIVFTGSASEANNQILMSCARLGLPGRTTIVSTPIEHPSVLASLDDLRALGVTVVFCPVDRQGRIVFEQLAARVDARTLLVCCMLANNETGVVQEVRRVADLAHRHGALAMSDCVQALGKIPVDVHRLGVDFASFSAHKIHGPKGVGALYVGAGRPLRPLIHGGHQENGLRAGTEAVHNIAGFAAACRNVAALLAAAGRVAELRDRLAEGIGDILPAARVNSPADGLANTLSVTLPGFDSAEAIGFLDYHGISVSAGSACNTQANEASHVLKAVGLSDEDARQTLRFSLSAATTAREIRYALKVLRAYLRGGDLPVSMVRPDQVDEHLLTNDDLFVLDIRAAYDRKLLKGLPNAHEAATPLFLKRYLHAIPRNKHILVFCQAGTDGPIAAYYLKSKGYRHVAFVMGGALGWKLFQPELYEKLGDRNRMPLKTESGTT
ncbi:MAG TPA: aminotransferase class V-fold PLP-dependent enzyme [Accumulibacter sp.]|nr:aminotransferase class V-fold PLP-dependent enzyme [Accumulibacter sp.]HQC80391.1 aminotransferase class V-fold PLP-dependent enzyme [Accumulibacter sp.]